MTPKEIRAREVVAHPERFEAESAESKAYEMTMELTGEARVEAIVAIFSGPQPVEYGVAEVKEKVEEIVVPKKKGRPAKRK